MTSPSNDQPKGFWPFITLQAQGAFSDSVFKQMLVLYAAAIVGSSDPNRLGRLTAYLLILMPGAYLLCSCWGGFLADKFSKRLNCLYVKLLELAIMAVGFIIFLNVSGKPDPSIPIFAIAGFVLFLMYVQSAFFSPNKYGIIPELVSSKRISWANGIAGMTTYVAIILGLAVTPELFRLWGVGNINTDLGALSADHGPSGAVHPGHIHYIMFILMILAVVGFVAGLLIPRTEPANPQRPIHVNFLPELKRYVTILFRDQTLLKTTLGICYFWGLGSVVSGHLQVWGGSSLGFGIIGASRLYWVLATGIAIGSMLAAALSRHGTEPGLVPLGAVLLGVFSLPMALADPSNRVIMIVSLAMFGVGGGLFIVPLNAILQEKTDIRDRGGLLAAVNYFDQTTILIFMGIYLFMNSEMVAIRPNTVYLVISIATLAGVIISFRLLPSAFLRLIMFLLTHLVYRIRVFGRKNIPESGPALLVCNHVSFIDALLVMSLSRRPIRFIVHESHYNKTSLRWGMKILQCIPISAEQNPREMLCSLKSAAAELETGELVCIFAEGQITRTGQLLPFRRGFETILKYSQAPVIPIYLDGVWGSIFSFEGGRFFWKWPRRIPYPVRVAIGKPHPPDTNQNTLRQAMIHLSTEMALVSGNDTPLLHHSLIQSSRRFPRLFMMTDERCGKRMSMSAVVIRSIILARRLSGFWKDQENVGILLPPSVGGAIVNYAATLSGRTSVNLNYTIGQDVLEACAGLCELKTVMTSREFMEKVGLKPPCEAIYAEGLATNPKGPAGWLEIVGAVIAAKFLPVCLVEKYCRSIRKTSPDTPATIIFSSGSTGMPKGVMLSHFNIASNIQSFRQAVNLWPQERMLGTLPFFHSFGYTVCLWGSAQGPFGVVYHPNPLDLKAIGSLIPREKVSLMITTPTFLTHYMRRLPPETFGGLNGIITGAEKLTDSLRKAFLERFGIEPLQGYGATECAPAISLNVNNSRAAGFHQVGNKPDSVGLPLPGISVRVLDPETSGVLPVGESGLLEIRGPNVMQGYLGMPEKTSEVLKDGWYNTGDIGHIDEDGFLFITDRLNRFSKIGGEMVPHVTIEDKMHELLGLDDRHLVVTAVPDEKKGEQLVVLTVLNEEQIQNLKNLMPACGLAPLWIPPPKNYFRVMELPVLGTGKLDLKGCRQMAMELNGMFSTQTI
jgi:acyl-[acyl-carrier-protein]-phospholipid O-acyltransferase/long-chain-fatty-acid--[acyl-carrier-protein] ligase